MHSFTSALRRSSQWVALGLLGLGLVMQPGAQTAFADHAAGGGQSFTFLQAGFTQDVYGVSGGFMGGVAFAPDGDPWVTPCAGGGGGLYRFDRQAAPTVVNTTPLQPVSSTLSDAGCGLTNHPNGALYTNQYAGVVKLDANTGAHLAGPFGPGGDALGITSDPQTGRLVYVGGDGTIQWVDENFTTSGVFSTAATGHFVDGIFFDPSGDHLFLSDRAFPYSVKIVARDGSLVQSVAVTSEPDGIFFHASSPQFVVTNNTDGTMTRLDFPGNDYSLVPAQSVFASGGFRGDLTQVGPDGCIYITQDGTRYNNGVTDGNNSLVRICGGFNPPVGVSNITLTPPSATNPVGTTHTVVAKVTKDGKPLAGQLVSFAVLTGPTAGASGVCVPVDCKTAADGTVSWTYTGIAVGTDSIQASFTDDSGFVQKSSTVTKTWTKAPGPCDNLNGGFEKGFVCWTPGGINGGIARIETEHSCFSANNTQGQDFAGVIDNSVLAQLPKHALNVRSSVGAPVDSVGFAYSDPTILGGKLRFIALSENDDAAPASDPVELEVRILSADGLTILEDQVVKTNIVTMSAGTSTDGCLVGEVRQGTWSSHEIDTLDFAGQTGRIEFLQHTKVAGKGFFTLIDDVTIVPAVIDAAKPVAPRVEPVHQVGNPSKR